MTDHFKSVCFFDVSERRKNQTRVFVVWGYFFHYFCFILNDIRYFFFTLYFLIIILHETKL